MFVRQLYRRQGTAGNAVALLSGSTIVSDQFNRSNSTTAIGTADTGQTWTNTAGTWGINGNAAYVATPSGANDLATVDSGKSDGSVQAVITAGTMTGQGLIIRLTDANNYIYIFASDTSTLIIGTDVAGSFNTIATGARAWVSGDVLKVRFSGQLITASVNGNVIASVSSAVNTTATKHGLLSTASAVATSRWDNVKVTVP